MIKAVLDSNVWIRALLTPGPARELIEFFEREAFLCVYPDQLIRELQRVPSKRKLARIRIETLVALIDFIQTRATRVSLSQVPAVSRDPGDDPFLACSAVANCDFVVTGDWDLLTLGEYAGARIVRPETLLEILRAGT